MVSLHTASTVRADTEEGRELVERVREFAAITEAGGLPRRAADMRAICDLVSAPSVQDWRDIESAPKDGTRIDIWTVNGRRTDCWWYEPLGCWRDERLLYNHEASFGATHWQPLPPSPITTQKKDPG